MAVDPFTIAAVGGTLLEIGGSLFKSGAQKDAARRQALDYQQGLDFRNLDLGLQAAALRLDSAITERARFENLRGVLGRQTSLAAGSGFDVGSGTFIAERDKATRLANRQYREARLAHELRLSQIRSAQQLLQSRSASIPGLLGSFGESLDVANMFNIGESLFSLGSTLFAQGKVPKGSQTSSGVSNRVPPLPPDEQIALRP